MPGLEAPFHAMGGEGEIREEGQHSFHHVPVLSKEVIHYLAPEAGMTIVDATLGGAGHAVAILERGAQLIGFDRDPEALVHAGTRLNQFGSAVVLRQQNFSDLLVAGREIAPEGVDGILLDLGVSSYQLDSAKRGFSLRSRGPLDMRMDPGERITAAELVNEWDEADLARIFHELGEERKSRAVAKAIVRRRITKPFRDTLDLADFVAGVVGRKGRIHPATRVFQALRMTVNNEMEALQAALEGAPELLKPGGRMVVITFHSLEDRLVKRFFKSRSVSELDRPEWPAPRPNPDCCLRVLTRRPVIPSDSEVAGNPRARSAKLRVAEKRKVGEG
ncbi:MAG: 16S rRNA (cytosine(1402)-N(4))-methyltransferase RsmH [Roseibacillus sp.]|nr:16S rRNA (cytosine(1402)-N(4))-methyltransferase RsmH [Roseibacillus sp.]